MAVALEPTEPEPAEKEAPAAGGDSKTEDEASPAPAETEDPPPAEEGEDDQKLGPGSVVILQGLKGKPEWNGKKGVIAAFFEDVGRFAVGIEDVKGLKRLKPENLKNTGERDEPPQVPVPKPKPKLRETNSVDNKLDCTKFVFGKQIGQGPHSRIIRATRNEDYDMYVDPQPDVVVMKAISKRSLTINRYAKLLQRALINEKETMYICRDLHPFVLKLFGTSKGVDDVFFIMEYSPNEDLQSWARKLKGLPLECVRFYTACLVDVLDACHRGGVWHRDIKPENVFLDANFMPKLGDFGCAITKEMQIDFMGTPHYMPPEMVRHQVTFENVRATDYWSLAATVFFLAFGELCFKGSSEYLIMVNSRDGNYKLPSDPGVDADLKDFIKKLLVIDVEQRLGWSGGWDAIRKHPFLAKGKFDWQSLRDVKETPFKGKDRYWAEENQPGYEETVE